MISSFQANLDPKVILSISPPDLFGTDTLSYNKSTLMKNDHNLILLVKVSGHLLVLFPYPSKILITLEKLGQIMNLNDNLLRKRKNCQILPKLLTFVTN